MTDDKVKKLPVIVESTQENEPPKKLSQISTAKPTNFFDQSTSVHPDKQKSAVSIAIDKQQLSTSSHLIKQESNLGLSRSAELRPSQTPTCEGQPTPASSTDADKHTPSITVKPEVTSYAEAMFGLATDAVMPLESELSFATGTPSKVVPQDGLSPSSATTISAVSIVTVGGAAPLPAFQADFLPGDDVSSVSDMSLVPASDRHVALLLHHERAPSPTGSRSEASFTESTLDNVSGRPTLPSTGHLYEHMYVHYCQRLGVVPISHFIRHIHDTRLTIKHRGLKPREVKALAALLVPNSTITVLDLEDNWIDEQGLAYIGDMLQENFYITELNLAYNKLGCNSSCVSNLSEIVLSSYSLLRLDISGNNILDSHGVYISKILAESNYLKYLNLSHNQLGDLTGPGLGTAIADNCCMEELDLSWNCFRGKAGAELIQGIKNSHLRAVNLAWNGLADAGAEKLANLITTNHILRELNITSNRITTKGTDLLAKAVKDNETLTALRLGRNSWSMQGTLTLLNNIMYNPNSAMKQLDLEDVHVSPQFLQLQELANSLRPISITHKFVAPNYLKCGVY